MLDLFGHEVSVYRGQPTESVTFTDDEIDVIESDTLYSGLLIVQLSADLKKIARIGEKPSTIITKGRREAWSGLMWCFDLWTEPAKVPFDLACDLIGIDSEQIRCDISAKYGDEIRTMVKVLNSHFPEEGERFKQRLRRYVDLSIH